MGTFATKKILQGNPSLIPVIAEQIKTEFAAEQFEVQIDNLLSGGVDISYPVFTTDYYSIFYR